MNTTKYDSTGHESPVPRDEIEWAISPIAAAERRGFAFGALCGALCAGAITVLIFWVH